MSSSHDDKLDRMMKIVEAGTNLSEASIRCLDMANAAHDIPDDHLAALYAIQGAIYEVGSTLTLAISELWDETK